MAATTTNTEEICKKFYWNINVPAVQFTVKNGVGTDILINPNFKIESPLVDDYVKENGYKVIVVKNPNPSKEVKKDEKCIDSTTGLIRRDQDLIIFFSKKKPLIIDTLHINF